MTSTDLVARLRAEVEYDNDEPNGPGEITYGRLFAEAADRLESLSTVERERDELAEKARVVGDMWNKECEALTASQAEVARLTEALKLSRAYVVQAVDDDGGIDSCEVGDRVALERIDAALQGGRG